MARSKTLDDYCDDIPDTVGINYYLYAQKRWSWHRINMPAGAYDEVLGYGSGYQLSLDSGSPYVNYWWVGK